MDIESMLPHTGGYKTVTGRDADQVPTWSSLTQVACREQAETERVRDAQGNEVVSHRVVYSAVEVPHGALWFSPGDSGADNTTGRRVIRTDPTPSLDGSQTLYKARI